MLLYAMWLIGIVLMLVSGVYVAKIIAHDSSVLDFSTRQLTKNHVMLATTLATSSAALLFISGATMLRACGVMADISLGLYVITLVLGGVFVFGEIHKALDQKKR